MRHGLEAWLLTPVDTARTITCGPKAAAKLADDPSADLVPSSTADPSPREAWSRGGGEVGGRQETFKVRNLKPGFTVAASMHRCMNVRV